MNMVMRYQRSKKMHQQLSATELAEVQRDFPVRPMTKGEKLNAWAELVERYTGGTLTLYHRLEYLLQDQLDYAVFMEGMSYPSSAILLAIRHEPFQVEGIGNSIGSAMRFFELSRDELHEFSCDCGGSISNKEQAERIRNLAPKLEPKPQPSLKDWMITILS